MADEADIANAYAEREIDSLLASRVRPPTGIGPMWRECGNKIPEARREHGFGECVECARYAEARR